jgi:hypothetical protein
VVTAGGSQILAATNSVWSWGGWLQRYDWMPEGWPPVRGPPTSGGCAMGLFPVHGKTLIKKRRKMGQIYTMKIKSTRSKDFRLATCNVRSLYRPEGLCITINELRKYKIAIAAIQETRWNKWTPQAFTSNSYKEVIVRQANLKKPAQSKTKKHDYNRICRWYRYRR